MAGKAGETRAARATWIVALLLMMSVAAAPNASPVDEKETRHKNIVAVLLDEFPLGILLDEHGSIDRTRFPNFARLARTSTWYPKATTVAPATHLAVPSILTGVIPKDNPYPTFKTHPRSLFTLFARSHKLHVMESHSHLCPTSLCGDGPDPYSEFSDPKRFPESPTRFKLFVSTIRKTEQPGLWFHHAILPHSPYLWLPDGRPYNVDELNAVPFLFWPGDEGVTQVLVQRLVLQTMYVDTLVGQLLDRLKAQRMLNDTMLVLMADHGAGIATGGGVRRLDTQAERDGLIPIPLFVRYPDGQRKGVVDRREVSEIDVLPTIADALGVGTPPGWDFDGRSLLIENAAPRPTTLLVDNEGSQLVTVEDFDPKRVAAYLRGFLSANGDPHDPYRIGPYGAVVGRRVSSFPQASAGGTVTSSNWLTYEMVDPEIAIPSRFDVNVTGVDLDGWVAIAVNGTIAGLGPAYFDSINQVDRAIAMLDPSYFVDGQNKIEVFEIDSDGRTLHPLERHG